MVCRKSSNLQTDCQCSSYFALMGEKPHLAVSCEAAAVCSGASSLTCSLLAETEEEAALAQL